MEPTILDTLLNSSKFFDVYENKFEDLLLVSLIWTLCLHRALKNDSHENWACRFAVFKACTACRKISIKHNINSSILGKHCKAQEYFQCLTHTGNEYWLLSSGRSQLKYTVIVSRNWIKNNSKQLAKSDNIRDLMDGRLSRLNS